MNIIETIELKHAPRVVETLKGMLQIDALKTELNEEAGYVYEELKAQGKDAYNIITIDEVFFQLNGAVGYAQSILSKLIKESYDVDKGYIITDKELLKHYEDEIRWELQLMVDYLYRTIDQKTVKRYSRINIVERIQNVIDQVEPILKDRVDGYDIYIIEAIEEAVEEQGGIMKHSEEHMELIYEAELFSEAYRSYEEVEETWAYIEEHGAKGIDENQVINEVQQNIMNIEEVIEGEMLQDDEHEEVKELLQHAMMKRDEIYFSLMNYREIMELKELYF